MCTLHCVVNVAARKGREEQGKEEGTRHTRMQPLPRERNMQRIEAYQPPADHPTIRELMEGRAAGADDEGIPPAGLPRRPPRSAYREEGRVAARRRVWARRIERWQREERRARGMQGTREGTPRP